MVVDVMVMAVLLVIGDGWGASRPAWSVINR